MFNVIIVFELLFCSYYNDNWIRLKPTYKLLNLSLSYLLTAMRHPTTLT